ncbi:MAG: hypothetical protein AB7V18_02755 [Pyrinomonadaceae bacterium]
MKLDSWWSIILVLLVVGLLSGLILGLFGELAGLSTTVRTGGVGVIIGVVGAFLISRKSASKQ